MSQSIEQELNELRSLVASVSTSAPPKTVKALEARLAALEERLASDSEARDPGEHARSLILKALSVANEGKVGHLSIPQIEERCKMTKSAVHTHVNELEKKGKVWIRKTHGANGRPVFYVYHPSAVRA
jgi:DNA-binding MarR family transcriptional regulator